MELRRAIVHELANKISTLKQVVELNRDKFDREFLYLVDNIDALTKLLLDLEIAGSENIESKRKVNLSHLMEDVLSELELLAELKGIEFSVKGCTEVEVTTNEILLKRILYNLLHNAVKYSQEGGKVEVVCHPSVKELEIKIVNSVGGKHPKGSGVGLQVTRELAKRVGVSVDLTLNGARAKALLKIPL